MPQTKKGVYLRLDQDVLEWLKAQGPGYQTRINTILRAYMETHQPSQCSASSRCSSGRAAGVFLVSCRFTLTDGRFSAGW